MNGLKVLKVTNWYKGLTCVCGYIEQAPKTVIKDSNNIIGEYKNKLCPKWGRDVCFDIKYEPDGSTTYRTWWKVKAVRRLLIGVWWKPWTWRWSYQTSEMVKIKK